MSNYKVEMVEIRQRKNGEFLQLKLCDDKLVGFFEKEDIEVKVSEGDIVSCKIAQKGKFYNGTKLKVIDKESVESADFTIETELKIDSIIEPKKPIGNDAKLHAGPRIYHFEIKNTSKGDKFLVITEQSGSKRNRIFVFNDHADKFSEKVGEFLKKLKEK